MEQEPNIEQQPEYVQPQPVYEPQASFFETHSTLLKGLLIAFLVLLMMIPIAFIMALIEEREKRQVEVVGEISNKWATEQTITGPIIAIPAYKTVTDNNGNTKRESRMLHFLPDELLINGEMKPEVRHRSLYDVSVYRSALVLEGKFNAKALTPLLAGVDSIDWGAARLVVDITDSRGLDDNPVLTIGGQKKQMEMAVYSSAFLKQPVSAPITISEGGDIPFKVQMNVKGTGQLFFTPCGNSTVVNISSGKGTPSYDGKYMPDKIATKPDSGFAASWKILHISRGYPQSWVGDISQGFEESAFGVRLIQEADHYAKTQRSVKYAILIISLTFLVFFFAEMVQKRRIHPLQYALVGFALCVFYTLLLSISEYTGFNIAYVVAALATISLITWYIYQVFDKMSVAAGFSGVITGLYAYIFFLIQLKDYALLVGSIGLFVILAVIMYYSRKINWYQLQKPTVNEP